MASGPAEQVVKVKLVPDLSEFTRLLTQELDLDDPLAKAIIAHAAADARPITATVGTQTFELDHWTIDRVGSDTGQRARLRTAWRPVAEHGPGVGVTPCVPKTPEMP